MASSSAAAATAVSRVVASAPQFVEGQRVIVFLGATGPAMPWIVGFNQGVFRLHQVGGTWVVRGDPRAQPDVRARGPQLDVVRSALDGEGARQPELAADRHAVAGLSCSARGVYGRCTSRAHGGSGIEDEGGRRTRPWQVLAPWLL